MCGGPPILGKTEDGGETWRFMLGPGDVKMNRLKDLFFLDDRIGFVHGYTYPGEPKIFATTDGGETWKGVVGSPGTSLRFADPEVGWGFGEQKLSYTTDGGARWNSRPHRFPAHPRAVSFPRRDRGYVVGDNGMVFRYRVVPAAQATPPEVIVTVAMPAFGSPLEEQVGQVEATLAELAAAVDRAPDAAGSRPATDSASPPGSEPASPDPDSVATAPDSAAPQDSASPIAYDGAEVAPASSFASGCCGKPLNKLNVMLAALVQGLPQFAARFKNTNLLTAGLRMLSTLPAQLGAIRGAYLGFKQSGDKDSARAALDQLTGAVSAFHQSTKAAFQLEIPPPDASPNDAPADAFLQTTGEAAAIVDSTVLPARADSLTAGVKNGIEKKAKKGLGNLIKKKVRIP
jgi:hypothetical protein